MAALRAVTSINGDPEGGVACLLEAAVADAPQTEESWTRRHTIDWLGMRVVERKE